MALTSSGLLLSLESEGVKMMKGCRETGQEDGSEDGAKSSYVSRLEDNDLAEGFIIIINK